MRIICITSFQVKRKWLSRDKVIDCIVDRSWVIISVPISWLKNGSHRISTPSSPYHLGRKIFNLSQIHGCSTLRGKYPLSQMLAYHLRKILNQQFVPGCYPVIVEGNLFYYVKLKCDTPMRVIISVTPYVRWRERINKNWQREFNQICTRKSQNIFQSRLGWEYRRRSHCQVFL